MFVPVSKPLIDESDVEAVAAAVRRKDISGAGGPELKEFEEKFAQYCDVPYGVSVSNGTVALHLALAALKIGPGDEVIAQSFTNMATFFAILYLGATPVVVDSEPDTLNIDPSLIEAKITPKTKAILVVHIYGHPVDMDPILAIAKKHNLYVVEDVAEAHGALYKGKKVGSLGDIGCFSMYANKILTTGEGGMLTMKDPELAQRAKMLRSLAFGKENKFMHQEVGFNYRLTNMQAALGVSQLKKIDKIMELKRAMAAHYLKAFADVAEFQLPVEKEYAFNVYWMFNILLKGKLEGKRMQVMEELKKRGIETRESFIPFSSQEYFIAQGLVKEADCPVAHKAGLNGFYLPSGTDITQEELEYVSSQTLEVVKMLS